jgi:hypothetical protein
VLFVKYNWNEQILEDKMGRTCRMHDIEEKCMWGYGEKAKKKQTSRKILTQKEGYY